MMQKSIWTILFSALCLCTLCGQSDIGLVAYYSFDACDALDDSGNGADGVITGSPGCVCGVTGNALALDGQDDYIQFLGNFDLLFSSNFTISFYIRPESGNQVQNVLVKKERCDFDSTLTIRFNGNTYEVSAEMFENIGKSVTNRNALNRDNCWHHVAFVRNSAQHTLFFNGIPQTTENAPQQLKIDNNGIFSIADSPCLANGEARYHGEIDELRLYNRALSTAEILELYTPIDILTNRDTIIFTGNSLKAKIPVSCASSFNWIPQQGVQFPFDKEPVLAPSVSTTYTVEMNYGNCLARDTVRIIVVDSSALRCDQIFLPKAFTPNNDGLNETFGISNPVLLAELKSFEIFDRWGSLVFETSNPDETWDGTFQGKDMMPGMYIYKLRYFCNGKEDLQVDSFTLIR